MKLDMDKTLISTPLEQDNAPLIARVSLWLSSMSIEKVLGERKREQTRPNILDIGCGYDAFFIRKFYSRIDRATGLDVKVNPALANLNRVKFLEGDITRKFTVLEKKSLI